LRRDLRARATARFFVVRMRTGREGLGAPSELSSRSLAGRCNMALRTFLALFALNRCA
jgi:hypothetical protein